MPSMSAGVSTSRPIAMSGTGNVFPCSETVVARGEEVVAQDVAEPEARLRRRVVGHRRHVERSFPRSAGSG